MQKRLISMVLALSMALTAMPLPALAQSAPPDTASAAALAEENGDVTDIYTDDNSSKPYGDLFGNSNGSWSYDETSNTLTLVDGTFRLYHYSYSSSNNYSKLNLKIEPNATLQEARIGSEYHNGYTVTNAGTISGGTFYGKVICEAGAVISGGTFKGNAIVNAAGGKVTIEGGTFEEGSYTSGVTVKAAGTLTINGGTFKGKRTCSVDIDNCEKIVINGGSFETSLTDLKRTTEIIIINGGLFNDKLYVAGDKCTVNGGLFTTEDDPLPEDATVNGGYFTAKSTGLVVIDATNVPVYAPVAVAADGTVTEWSADTYSTLYVTPNTSVTLKPTRKLESVSSGDNELNYTAKGGAVSFTVGTEAVQFNSVTVGELVIEKSGFPKGTDGGVYGAKGNGWSFEPNHKHAELFTNDVPTLTIEKGAVLDFDKVTNKAGTVKFAVENYGTFSGTLNSTRYVYNREGGVITDAKLNSPQSLYNDGLVEDSVLCFDYIGNGWRDPAQPATIRNSALDVTGYSVVNMASNKAVLDGCYNSAGYTGTAVIKNGGTVENSKNTLKLPVKNTAGYDGNAEPYQPIIDGGECTVVYNEGGIIQNNPTIHALVAKDTKDLNGAADYYTLNYTAPEDAEYAKKYINGINGMMEGIWDAKTSTLYVDTDQDTISVITHAPIKSVNGVAYNGSVADGERYNSTIDLRKYNIPQTRTLNLSATDEGVAALPDADPADFAFVLPNDLTYDGNPKRVDVDVRESATKEYGAVTVTYKQDGKVLSGAPVEPGTYTFTAVVAPTATCAGGDVTPKYNTFTIQKAALTPADFTVTEPTDLTYNGTAKEVTVKNTSDKDYGEITVTYKQNGEALNGAPTEPGEYSYTVTAAGSARYVGGTVKTGSFRITKTGTTDPEPEKTYQLTVAGADITLPEDADASALKAGQLVSLTAYPDTDTVHFAQWVVSGADGALSPADLMDAADEPLTEDAFKQRTLTFRMPAKSLTITAETTTVEQPEQPPEEDSTEYSPLQTVGILAGTTAMFAGCAVIGYEFVTGSILVDLLPKGTAIPSTREQLAVLLWSTAGKPEPTAPAVYSDVAEPDAAKAARWAVEAGLLPDMGEGVFTPGKRVTKVQVIRAWSQLKKLGLAK